GEGSTDGEGDGGSADSGSGEVPAKCAFVVDYGGDSYSDRGDVRFELGARAGTARAVPCDDTPGEAGATAEPAVYEAYEAKGLDPSDAVAIRLSPDEEPIFVVRITDDLPPEIEKLFPADER
ncbi:DUF6281 family protein, partial [Streptomyces sp. MB09-02B]|uniref:DUF6281 family protein n=1 Tax=Streptomyces sp. MB09-02B TaxID=3028667 RepID=UPI0029B16CB2